jgi:hypothetical protein
MFHSAVVAICVGYIEALSGRASSLQAKARRVVERLRALRTERILPGIQKLWGIRLVLRV